MKNLLLEVEIIKVLIGDITKLELNIKNKVIIKFPVNNCLLFSLQNSYEIDFDKKNQTAKKFNIIIAEVIGDENDDIIANMFFGKSEVDASLILIDRGYEFSIKVRPFLKAEKKTFSMAVNARLELIERTNRKLRL